MTRARLAAIDHFSGLSANQLNRLLDGSDLVDYEASAPILDPTKAPGGYAFLVAGRWWMRRTIQGTMPHDWVDDRPGNWHGGIPLIDAVAPPEVRAEDACTVLHVPRDLLNQLAAQNRHLGAAMLRGVRGGAAMLHAHATGETS
ncbi:MAG: hypothetical protein AAGE03_06020 [Pseudomonadota bacterium]